jgi:hypothetical protein
MLRGRAQKNSCVTRKLNTSSNVYYKSVIESRCVEVQWNRYREKKRY